MRFLPGCKKMLISLLVSVFSLSMSMHVQAAAEESGTLTICLQNEKCEAELAVYQVAAYCDGEFAILPEFVEEGKDPSVDLHCLQTASDIKKAVDFFAKRAVTQKIIPDYQSDTKKGVLSLGEIPTGLYLIMQIPHKGDRLSIQDFLITVPCREAVNNEEGEERTLLYDVEAFPKEEELDLIPETSDDQETLVETGDKTGKRLAVYGVICLFSGGIVYLLKTASPVRRMRGQKASAEF